MNSAAATASTVYAIATTEATPSRSSRVATAASSSLPTAPDWHAFSTTTGTPALASTVASVAAVAMLEDECSLPALGVPSPEKRAVSVKVDNLIRDARRHRRAQFGAQGL